MGKQDNETEEALDTSAHRSTNCDHRSLFESVRGTRDEDLGPSFPTASLSTLACPNVRILIL